MLLVYWILYLKYIPVFFAVNLPFQVKSLRESLCTSSSVRWTRITVKLQRVWEHQKIKIVTLEPPYKTADLSEPFAWLIRTSYWLNYRNHFLSIIICLELWKTEGLISFILQTRNWDLERLSSCLGSQSSLQPAHFTSSLIFYYTQLPSISIYPFFYNK